MKVVWFVNSFMPEVIDHLGLKEHSSGPWMKCLLDRLSLREDLDIVVVAIRRGERSSVFRLGRVTYYVVGLQKRIFGFSVDNGGVNECAKIIKDERPDVVHFHGTELQYINLLRDEDVATKSLVTLQGVMYRYAPKVQGELTVKDVLRCTTFLDTVRGRGIFWSKNDATLRGEREKELLLKAKWVGGRTDWDRAIAWALAGRGAKYCELGELLREEFWGERWDSDTCVRNSLLFTNVSGPIKGAENLIDAVSILNKKGIDVTLNLAGRINPKSPYGARLLRKIRDEGLEDKIVSLGYLDAGAMAKALTKANVFVSSSYVDNSPNSIAEAQLVGIPVVATYVGGVPTMIDGERTGLLVPAGEPELLAQRIRDLLSDRSQQLALSAAEIQLARARHDPEKIVNDMVGVYQLIKQEADKRYV